MKSRMRENRKSGSERGEAREGTPLLDKTIERERLAAEAVAKGEIPAEEVKRKPGRPKGSKNKKTLEREARERAQLEQAGQKRRRGRPKESKNKRTLEREAKATAKAKKIPLIRRRSG